MISKLSKKLSTTLINLKRIDKSEQEFYDYGFFILFSDILFFMVVILTGLILKIPVEGVIFFITFIVVRQYAGGFHASTETTCTIFSISLIIICMLVTKLLLLPTVVHIGGTVSITIGILATILIGILAPIDTVEKPLTDKEKERFKLITVILLFIFSLVMLCAYVMSVQTILAPSSVAIFAECFLLVLGKIARLIQNKKAAQII